MLIGKNWQIKSDDMNVVLSQRTYRKAKADKPAHYGWSVVGYYSTVGNALKDLVNRGVSETELKDLRTVVGKIEELTQQIDQSLKSRR